MAHPTKFDYLAPEASAVEVHADEVLCTSTDFTVGGFDDNTEVTW